MKKKEAIRVEAEIEAKRPEFKLVKELNRPKFATKTFKPSNFTRVRSFGGHR
jgi:hypothetical protein